ncbi:hypothetical protein IC607_08550 [Cellulomonas sp. JH27-2]|uniref:competence protein CoiA family protein n=1 Tax=Cellulomonas sp. JH27-2 TaxID=2774139 RepID=UPI00177D26D3|nr:competence protein CoiA family protein [Cellulomonas sp. JH27-2]MBD8059016.1 hypothetical protein [Cellulomonas sp. JH27-2]
MSHDPALIAAFNADADTRMVWATERADRSQVVYLDDGTAEQMRQRTKSSLACIVPECDIPLTTHARKTKRDGFAHLGRVDDALHCAESLMHQQAKAVIVSWLRARYPHVRIDPEVLLVNGERRPDVYAENPATGNKLAFEVQYSALTIAEWDRRHQWYAEHDIVDVWVFGHVGPQRRRPRTLDTDVVTNALQEHLLAKGELLWWVEPTAGIIATPYMTAFDETTGHTYNALPREHRRDLSFELSALAESWLTAKGFRTPALIRMDEAAEQLTARREHARRAYEADVARRQESERLALSKARVAQEAEARRTREQAEALEAARQAQEQSERRRAELDDRLWREALMRTITPADTLDGAWASSEVRHEIEFIFGSVPEWLFVDYSAVVPESALGISHPHWQAAAFLYALKRSTRRGPGRPRPTVPVETFIEGVASVGMRFERRLLDGLLLDWCGHLYERRQLGQLGRDGHTRVLTKLPVREPVAPAPVHASS